MLLVLAGSLIASRVGAQSEEERLKLYREGVALAEQQHWEEAAAKFRRVVEIRSAPKALFTLAQVEEKIGRLATAKMLYAQAAQSANAASEPGVAHAAEDAIHAISSLVPRLVFRLPSDISDAELRIDDRRVELLNGAVEVDPGARRVTVESSHRAPFRSTVFLTIGQVLDVAVLLPALPDQSGTRTVGSTNVAPTGEAHPQATRPASGTAIRGWVMVGAGGLAMLAGTSLLGLSVSDAAEANIDYDNAEAKGVLCKNGCNEKSSGDAAVDRAHVKQGIGGVALGLGAVSTAIGIYFLAASSNPASVQTVTVALTPTRGGPFASVVARF
jgi:tetratricopeptide (TPR) repeat protein